MITKCFQTIKTLLLPKLAENLCVYITGCHICQLHKKGPSFNRPFQKRIKLNVPVMTKMSMDIKHMPHSRGYSFILVILCEVTNFMVTLPLSSMKIQHIIDAFERGYLAYYGPPTHIICDMDPTFTSSLMEAFSRHLNIKVITVSPTNHKFLLAKHVIKSLSSLLIKHLEEVWSWSSCLPYSMLCYNSYSSPNVDGFSPYELTFDHKMTINPYLEVQPDIVVSGTFCTYYEKLKKNLQYLCSRLQRFRSQRTDLLNRNKKHHAYQAGQIVYMDQACIFCDDAATQTVYIPLINGLSHH